MKHNLEKRLAGLEVKAKPSVISTLLDLINCIGENGDVELSPELQALVEEASKEDDHETKGGPGVDTTGNGEGINYNGLPHYFYFTGCFLGQAVKIRVFDWWVGYCIKNSGKRENLRVLMK